MLRAACFACGLAVCTAPGCSTRAPYRTYGRRRVCSRCLEEALGDDPTILAAWTQMKGELAVALAVPFEVVSVQWDACCDPRGSNLATTA